MIFDASSLPADWRISPIREIILRTSQSNPGKNPDKLFRYVDVSSVDNTLFRVREAVVLKGSEAPSRARKEIRENDVLFATVRPTLKRVALIQKDLNGEIASTGYCILRADPEKCDPRFLYSYLLTDWFIAAMGKLERGASYPAVRDTDVFSAKVPVPPLPEQRKIAAVLGTVQKAIEQQERIIQTTTELKKTLMQKLFTEGLRGEPQKETEIGVVPESWEVVPLGKLAMIERGKFSHRPRNEPRFYGGDYPFVQTGDVANCDGRVRTYTQTLNEDGLAISKMFPAGTILITIAANIGYTVATRTGRLRGFVQCVTGS